MGAYSLERSGPLTIVRFNAFSPEGDGMWPAAIVVWRGNTPAHAPRGIRAKWRAFRYRRGFDPLHAPFTFGSDAGLWLGAAGPEGERETLFHARRHVVRVLDREFPASSSNETLVLLIDDSDTHPRLITRIIPAQAQRLEHGVAVSHTIRVEPFADPGDPLVTLSRRDAEVRSFLES